MNINLSCSIRNEYGNNACNRIRNNGYVPGVMYGRNFYNYHLQMDKKEIDRILRQYGENVIVNVMVDGNMYQAMIKEVQKDMITGEIIHIDLQRVSDTEKIHTSVPIIIHGKETLGKDVIVQQQLGKIDIECYPSKMPKAVPVDISSLTIGSSLRVADVEFGEDITVLNDNEEVILSLAKFKEEVIEEDTQVEDLVTNWIPDENGEDEREQKREKNGDRE